MNVIEQTKKELNPILERLCKLYNVNSIKVEAGCNLERNNHYCEIIQLSIYK